MCRQGCIRTTLGHHAWVVLTGASCAGKTTLIDALQHGGFETAPEAARSYVEAEKTKGRTFLEVRRDDHEFRKIVLAHTIAAEVERLDAFARQLIFLDRSVVDSISVFRAAGLNPHAVLPFVKSYRYAMVFHCNMLPFVDDGSRILDERRRSFLDVALELDYRALGYQPIRVPFGSVAERLEFLLKKCAHLMPTASPRPATGEVARPQL